MVVATVAIDGDQMSMVVVHRSRGEARRVELFPMLDTRDVLDLGFVVERHELSDQQQHHRESGGEC